MENFQEFIGSFSFDQRLAPYDIEGSIAHVRMLVTCGILSASDGKKIVSGLSAIAADLKKGKQIPKEEDIHYAVEKELIRRIGPLGGKMHTARSRNDQVALDLRLYLRDQAGRLIALLKETQRAILLQAEKNSTAVMPGYTHLQPAQPVLFAHYLLAYGWMFERDKERLVDCVKRINRLPLGSAALAGTSFPIDRRCTAKLLGFGGVMQNSLDGVSDRDFALEFLSVLSIVAMHLSRLMEELVIWSSAEFDFIRLADEFTSGSSIMPQKRNPDVAEIVRGKTGRVYGDLFALLTLMKGIPLAYNRDMQEDKPPVFDAVDTVAICLEVAAGMVRSMNIKPANMLKATARGFLAATELADFLARQGVPFREAHGIVKKIVAFCTEHGRVLHGLSLEELRQFSPLFSSAIKELLAPDVIVNAKISEGGTAPRQVQKQIREMQKLCRQ
jgi:argininosuccinate lyase